MPDQYVVKAGPKYALGLCGLIFCGRMVDEGVKVALVVFVQNGG